MPLMSGYELAEKVVKLYKDKKRPKIIGITTQMILEDDPHNYINAFIYKPIDINELDKKIKDLIDV
jgi:CheY-like chemotaxis protein